MSINAPAKPLTIKDYKSDLHNDWCPGCITPDTTILTREGVKPISEIRVGEQVLGHDGGYHKVTEIMAHWHPASLRRLSIRHMGDIRLTDDHPMLILRARSARNGELESRQWVKAENVEPGDYVAYPVPHQAEPSEELPLVYTKKKKDTRSRKLPEALPLNHDFMRLVGYYVAEGYTHRREVAFTFSSEERHLADDVVALVGRLLELPATITERPAQHTLDVRVSSSYLAEIFRG